MHRSILFSLVSVANGTSLSSVIPAQAGIHALDNEIKIDSRLRGNDGRHIRLLKLVPLVSVAALTVTAPLSATILDDVVVTATRIEQPIDDVIGAVTVITRQDIEHRQPQSVLELLRNEVGIDLTSQGGFGKLTAMFVRGTENEHVLVLIDGVRVGSATSGTTPFEYLPVEQIERVEIVRGPRSSLYGSDAIGGVIQIFTRKGGDRASARIGGGTYDTFQASGNFAVTVDNTTITASASKQSTQGFNSCRGSGVTFQGCFTDEPDRDGFSNRSGSLRIGHRADFAEFDLSAVFAEGHTEYDGSFANETDFRGFTPSFRATFKPTDNWRVAVLAGSSRDEQNSFHDGSFRSTFDTERRNASLQSDVTLPANQIVTLGADFLDDNVASTTNFDALSRDNGGVFGQYQVGLGAHRVSASARYDDNQQFGSHSTGNAGWKWQIVPALYAQAGWGTAFRAPSFNDLYYPGFSNPTLLPERSSSYELGVGGKVGSRWTWSANAYRTKIDDLIDLDATFLPANISAAQIQGVEVASAVAFSSTTLSANYSYVDPRNATAGANHDKILQRRARQTGRVQVAQQLGPVRVSSIVRVTGSRYNNAANTIRLGSYGTVDLLGEWTIDKHWQLDVKVTNLLDKVYETVHLYNEPRLAFLVSLQYRMR